MSLVLKEIVKLVLIGQENLTNKEIWSKGGKEQSKSFENCIFNIVMSCELAELLLSNGQSHYFDNTNFDNNWSKPYYLVSSRGGRIFINH